MPLGGLGALWAYAEQVRGYTRHGWYELLEQYGGDLAGMVAIRDHFTRMITQGSVIAAQQRAEAANERKKKAG